MIFPTPCPEVADHATQGVVAVTGLLGDLLEGAPLDEVGAEGFIAAMERVGGFEEELRFTGAVAVLVLRSSGVRVRSPLVAHRYS